MYWLVTDAVVSRMLVDEFAVMPYKQAAESTCGFLADANAYTCLLYTYEQSLPSAS